MLLRLLVLPRLHQINHDQQLKILQIKEVAQHNSPQLQEQHGKPFKATQPIKVHFIQKHFTQHS